MKQSIIVVNDAMVDENGNALKEARILPDALMVHSDFVDKLIEGMNGIFKKKDFSILNSVQYKEHLNETYPDKTKRP